MYTDYLRDWIFFDAILGLKCIIAVVIEKFDEWCSYCVINSRKSETVSKLVVNNLN